MKEIERALATAETQIAHIESEIKKALPYVDLLKEKRKQLVLQKKLLEQNIAFLKRQEVIVSINEFTKIGRELKIINLEIGRIETELNSLNKAIGIQQKLLEALKEKRKSLAEKIQPKGVLLEFRKRKLD